MSRATLLNGGKWALALAVFLAALIPMPSAAADDDDDAGRKVVHQVKPVYPELARRMRISGQVRLEVLVAPDGKVKTVKTLGGHPLLVSAAEDAVKRWKFEPGAETKETRTFNFKPVE